MKCISGSTVKRCPTKDNPNAIRLGDQVRFKGAFLTYTGTVERLFRRRNDHLLLAWIVYGKNNVNMQPSKLRIVQQQSLF
jgi:hypothetical protein